MASVLGAQQFLSMGWPGQQAAATGWGGGVPGWGNAGGMAMMGWPAAAVPGAPQQPGFAANPNIAQSVTPPPPQLFGGGMPGAFQPGLGHHMPHQAQAPFMQPPNGMLVTAAQFQPGYAGLQHIPGVDASSMGTAIAQPPFQPQHAQQAQQAVAAAALAAAAQGLATTTAGDPTVAVDPAGGPGTVAGAIMQANRGSAEPLRAKAEAITGEAKPAGGSHRRGRSRPGSTANTGSGDGVVPQSPADGGGGNGAAQKAPPTRAASRRQRSRLSAASAGEVNDAGADSRSPQETLKLSQARILLRIQMCGILSDAKPFPPLIQCIPDPWEPSVLIVSLAERNLPSVRARPTCATAYSGMQSHPRPDP